MVREIVRAHIKGTDLREMVRFGNYFPFCHIGPFELLYILSANLMDTLWN